MDEEEKYYEDIENEKLVKLLPDDFYLHRPGSLKVFDWFFEFRLQTMLFFNMYPNYFGYRHQFKSSTKWFYDHVFMNHYTNDYLGNGENKWYTSFSDKTRYYWLNYTGYNKETKDFLALSRKVESGEASLREKKFLQQYERCRYWSYFDFKDQQDLAFFRMGIDRDEDLNNKPLFPNIAYSYPDDPVLMFNRQNMASQESIPSYQLKKKRKEVKKHIEKKWDNNEKVYYWDMRLLFNPETTKIHDFEFIIHVQKEHDGKPEDKAERKAYNEVFNLYNDELFALVSALDIPHLKIAKHQNKEQRNPLYIAYKARWFNKNKVKEFEKVFHGVSEEEYQEIVNKQYASLDKKPNKNSDTDFFETIKKLIKK